MEEQCSMTPRVEALEQTQREQGERVAVLEAGHQRHERAQEKQSETLDKVCENVKRMADSIDRLVSIVPLIHMAQAVNMISRWLAPPFAIIAGLWAAGHTIFLLVNKFGK